MAVTKQDIMRLLNWELNDAHGMKGCMRPDKIAFACDRNRRFHRMLKRIVQRIPADVLKEEARRAGLVMEDPDETELDRDTERALYGS